VGTYHSKLFVFKTTKVAKPKVEEEEEEVEK